MMDERLITGTLTALAPAIRGAIFRHGVGRREDREDVFCEVRLRLLRRLQRYDAARGAAPTTFLFRGIDGLVSEAAARIRGGPSAVPMYRIADGEGGELSLAEALPGADDPAKQTADRDALERLFADIDPRHRRRIELCALGYTLDEVGRRESCSPAAVAYTLTIVRERAQRLWG